MTLKLVSIILPVFNGCPDLIKSIDSICNQTYQNIELIIVNDGSTDNTKQYLNNLNNPNIKLKIINLNPNRGLPNALNVGLKHVSNESTFISWTSHDNVYHTKAIETMVSALNSNPDKMMVYTGHQLFNKCRGDRLPKLDKTKDDFMLNWMGICCFLWRKKISDKVGIYDTELLGVEDWDYFLRMLEAGPNFLPIRKILYYYQVHDNQLTKWMRKNKRYEPTETKMFNKMMKRHENDILKVKLFEDYVAKKQFFQLGEKIIKNKKQSVKNVFGPHAWKLYFEALKLNPKHPLAFSRLTFAVDTYNPNSTIKSDVIAYLVNDISL